MTSSEHNRVSIPPQRSVIGLTDDRSCDSSQQLTFHSVVFLPVFLLETGTGTYKLVPIVNLLFKSTGSLGLCNS